MESQKIKRKENKTKQERKEKKGSYEAIYPL